MLLSDYNVMFIAQRKMKLEVWNKH